MDKKSEKELRKTLAEDYEEVKKSVEEALNTVGFEVVYIDCNLSTRDGYSLFLNIKRRRINE